MAHRTRGFISHTYDVKEVLSVDLEKLEVIYTDAAHASPQVARVRADTVTVAGQQLIEAMAESLSVYGGGDWESAYGFRQFVSRSSRLLDLLTAGGITDLGTPTVTLRELREVIDQFDASMKRTLNKLLGRIVKKYHPNGPSLARALTNTSYMVVESRTELYDDAEVEAIKTCARRVFDETFKQQRDLFQAMGYDVSDRSWLRITADEVIGAARKRHPQLVGARQPLLSASRLEQIDWAVLNPDRLGVRRGRSVKDVLGETMLTIGTALYPAAPFFTAALVLQCLAELSGLNLSVMLRTQPDDLIYTGKSNGQLRLAKARNHSEDTLSVRTNSNSTLGGLIEALTGLTRFARHWRAMQLVKDEQVPEVVNRIYVEHKADPANAEVITNQRLHQGWRQPVFDLHWPEDGPDRTATGLRFQALRRKALEHAVMANPRADVHGHSPRTKVHYLAHVFPEHVLVRHATAAQDDIIDRALSQFLEVDVVESPEGRGLADAVKNHQTADEVVSVCVSGGNDPDQASKPCSLGLAACFTCPNGFRTIDHIPGLLATVRFTEMVRDTDPDEWAVGDAGPLHFYATESLKQFPSSVVETFRSRTNLNALLLTIEALYTEFRR